MIHYTLLPEKEIKILKREYRIRLVIFLLFFMSCSVLAGIISLVPAYVYSYTREKEVLNRLTELQKNREDGGLVAIKKELADTSTMIKKIKDGDSSIIYSSIVYNIINHKPVGVSINNFDLSSTGTSATSTISVTMQGKASTRESLVTFRDRLAKDPLITKVELPVSDLAKSKDISYSIKVFTTPIQ